MNEDMPRRGETVRWNAALWRVEAIEETEVRLINASTGAPEKLSLGEWLGGLHQELIVRRQRPETVPTGRPGRNSFMRWKDTVWKVTVVRSGIINLVNHGTGESGGISLAEWQSGCFEGAVEMLAAPDERLPESVRDLLKVPLGAMPPSMRRAVERAAPYLDAWRDPVAFYLRHLPEVAAGDRIIPRSLSKPRLTAFFEIVATAHRCERIGFSSFCKWLKKVDAADGDKRAMAPRHDRQGPHDRYMNPRVEDWLQEAIDTKWLTPSQQRKKMVWKALDEAVNGWNAKHPERRLTCPSQSHVARYIREEVDSYVAARRREGKETADSRFDQVHKGPETTYFGERVEVDNTLVKLNLRHDQTGVELGYPWLTASLDHFTRMPLSLHVNYENQSLGSALQCLRQTMSPKTFLRELVPELDYVYPATVPNMFFLDRGSDFDNQHLLLASSCLHVQMHYEPVACPRYKGAIERWWRTLKEDIRAGALDDMPKEQSGLAGVDEDGEPWMTYSEFVRRVWAWASMVYAKRHHRGIDDIPLRRLEESVARNLPRALRSKDDLNVLLTHVETCVPSRRGVTFDGLRWIGEPILAVLRHPSYREGMTVRVRFDEYDVSQAWVINPFTSRDEKLDPVDEAYMTGLSLHAHRLVLKAGPKMEKGRLTWRQMGERRAALGESARERIGLGDRKPVGGATPAVAKFLGIGRHAPCNDSVGDILRHPSLGPVAEQPREPEHPVAPETEDYDDDDFEVLEPVRPKRQARQVRNH